ncbi:MAG: aromatic ring-hydroxylating dioxygenase subunit alpha [Deltaproteobacteria bacterium]|nr:aromatic ring-hydroxylating dioxygenase subunit alpha [Deltaproteobacteria bacterium]
MTDYWYVGCESNELGPGKVKAVTILGIPLVLFRAASGAVGALLDRCPHRNVPLSAGKVTGNCLQCAYHGWEFATDGECTAVPGLVSEIEQKARSATSYPAMESQGFVWVYPSDDPPRGQPFQLPHLDDSRFTHARRQARAKGTLHATVENALDVPHTSFLHKGLFRGAGARNRIEAVIRRWNDRCEAQYIGEPRPPGVVGQLLAPSGGEVTHFDRFILPGIAQVDYQLGTDTHVCVTSLCTPVSDFDTKLFAVVSFRLGKVPGWVVKPFLEPLGRLIFAQDAKILKMQTEAIKRFGGEQFVSTDIDLLGPQIWRLMKAATRGPIEPSDELELEKSVEMTV